MSRDVGVVVIGRNEGERLLRCLRSVIGSVDHVVYVDSGSTDNSVTASRALGVAVVELDLQVPFTAARARNEGFHRLLGDRPQLRYVFFVDGDCEVDSTWLPAAIDFLQKHPEVAVACGRRRERHPRQSLYNMLCDLEWDTPVGEAKACGGDAVMRVEAFRQAGGYRPDLICGEEPELCVRLRQSGWKIWRLEAEMTLHDAALLHFSQWWKRMLRGGYAFAQGTALHGAPPERHWVRESRSAWIWGLGLPAAILLASAAIGPAWLLLFGVYPLQIVRLALANRRSGRSGREIWWGSAAIVACKFPEAAGQVKYLLDRQRRVQSRLIEYK